MDSIEGSDDRWPDNDAYNRVTNPERYGVLHAAALALLDEFESRYDVIREERADLEHGLKERVRCLQMHRLSPRNLDGAPVTVGLTDFPGVIVRHGRWSLSSYPACGCDACDEDPVQLAALMRQRFESVAAGGFQESRGHTQFAMTDASESGSNLGEISDEDRQPPLRKPPVEGWGRWQLREHT